MQKVDEGEGEEGESGILQMILLSAEERRSGGTSSGHKRNEADSGDNQWPVGMMATPARCLLVCLGFPSFANESQPMLIPPASRACRAGLHRLDSQLETRDK